MTILTTHFLIAERDPAEGSLVEKGVAALGGRALTRLNNGTEALDRLKSDQPYFVIASWELPGLGGLRLARETRRSPASGRQPCLLIVPEHHESEINMARGVDIDGFLPRPLTPDKVATRIKTVLERRNAGWPVEFEDLAEGRLGQEKPQEALAEYRAALDAGRWRLAGLHTEIGLLFKKQGKINQAIDHLEKAALAQPHSIRTQRALGETYLTAKRPAEAARALKRTLALDPSNLETKRLAADSFLLANENEQAEKVFAELLAKNPKDRFLLNRLGMALRKQGKFREAIDHYRKAVSNADIEDENLHFNLGRCLFETGQFEAATVELNKSLNLNPELHSARQILDKILQHR